MPVYVNTYRNEIDESARPFTARLRWLHDQKGHTYQNMEIGCGRAYSISWFQTLATNANPWTEHSPPREEKTESLAKMMRTDPVTLRRWVGREWYGIELPTISIRVQSMAADLDQLEETDASAVTTLVRRLPKKKPLF